MKEMTTAEFAKANFTALEEPVQVRRYTKVVGVYYPAGTEPIVAPPQPTLGLEDVAPASTAATAKIIEDLTEEISMLKKELAKRPYPAVAPIPVTRAVGGDPFAGLPKQDRDFFERKLGSSGRKKS